MPVLTDVEQDYAPSPRVSVVLAPRTSFIAQDVVETLRKFEDSFRGMSETKLVDASGKQELEPGVSVGITYALQNNQVQFEDRQTPVEIGTITTASVASIGGKILVIDAAADFVSAGVVRGSFVINWTDHSIVSIDSVIDLNTLSVKVPTSGLGNTYDIPDAYSVFNVVPCTLGGGNPTAVDDLAAAIEAAVPSVGTYLKLTLDTSATLVETLNAAIIAAQVADIHGQVQRSIFIDTEAIPNGDGYQQTPFNNWSDAVDDAEANNIKSLVVLADATVDRLIKNFTVMGVGSPTIDLNGQNVDKSEFHGCGLTGAMLGSVVARQCSLDTVTGLNGHFSACDLMGVCEIAIAGDVVMNGDPHSNVAGLGRPTFSMNASSIGAKFSLRGYSGGLTLTNCDHADDEVTLEFAQGKCTLDATCTDGTISVRGIAQLTNSSAGSTVDTSALIQPSKLLTIAKFIGLQ